MTDNAPPVVTPVSGGATITASASPKKAMAALSTKPRAKPSHPKVADMVNSAVKELKERGGSSLQAIKKYMAGTYKVDTEKQAPFIKRYIKSALASGALVQTKGKGAAGSFKLSPSAVKAATVKPETAKQVAKPKTTTKKAAAKKPAAPKKAASSSKPKKLAPKKSTTAINEKKKTTKGPAAKPPKAKTTKAKPTLKSPPKKVKAVVPKKIKPVTTATPKAKKAALKTDAIAKK